MRELDSRVYAAFLEMERAACIGGALPNREKGKTVDQNRATEFMASAYV